MTKEEKLEAVSFYWKTHFVGLAVALIGAVGILLFWNNRWSITPLLLVIATEVYYEAYTYQQRKRIRCQ